jgi:hypothetical protein
MESNNCVLLTQEINFDNIKITKPTEPKTKDNKPSA